MVPGVLFVFAASALSSLCDVLLVPEFDVSPCFLCCFISKGLSVTHTVLYAGGNRLLWVGRLYADERSVSVELAAHDTFCTGRAVMGDCGGSALACVQLWSDARGGRIYICGGCCRARTVFLVGTCGYRRGQHNKYLVPGAVMGRRLKWQPRGEFFSTYGCRQLLCRFWPRYSERKRKKRV